MFITEITKILAMLLYQHANWVKQYFLSKDTWARDSQNIHIFQILEETVFRVRIKERLKIGKRYSKLIKDNLLNKSTELTSLKMF